MIRRPLRNILVGLLIAALGRPAFAWGPHTEITAAALAVLPEREAWKKRFGADWDRIAKDYCWMGDWRESVRPDHYADDYLLFPGMATHPSHMLPEVRKTYGPFFRRALQALRTESAQNAARWIGSLLHFVQDSGSPPHTTGISGELHGKMERWVDEKQISIAGYEPRLLGKTDEEAERAFLARMEGLIEFSRVRAEKLKPLVENLKERVNQPMELECALEVARVSADVIHTLCTLGLPVPPGNTGDLIGEVEYRPPAGYAAVPAKIVLAGTPYSTTADAEGKFYFANLPSDVYDIVVIAPGHESRSYAKIGLTTAEVTGYHIKPDPDPVPGNLLRNARFSMSWIVPGQPDFWTRDPKNKNRWSAALVRVPVDQACEVSLDLLPDKQLPAAIRWRTNPSSADGREVPLTLTRRDSDSRLAAEVTPPKDLVPFEQGYLFLELLLESEKPLAESCRHAAVRFLSKKDAK